MVPLLELCYPPGMASSEPRLFELFRRRPTQYLKKNVTIQDRSYPVTILGSGRIPCVCIGVGTLLQRTLPDGFFEKFQLFSMDTYWIAANRLPEPERVTLQSIVDDILEAVQQLGLKKYFLMGHSCFGMVAIEVAKRSPQGLVGVMAVASPPRWDKVGIEKSCRYFEENASEVRKANHASRQKHFESMRKLDESIVSVNAYEADAAKYFYQFDISRKELEVLWENVEVDDALMNHFFGTLLPGFDLSLNMGLVKVPVMLAAGEFDYDSTPLYLWKDFPKPIDFTIIDCGNAGHWPQAENPEVFEKETWRWANKASTEKGRSDV